MNHNCFVLRGYLCGQCMAKSLVMNQIPISLTVTCRCFAQRRAGHWLIITSQNTNKIAGTPPESEGIATPIVLPEQ